MTPYETMASFEHLYAAYRAAARGKHGRDEVTTEQARRSIAGIEGHLRHGDIGALRRRLLGDEVPQALPAANCRMRPQS